MPTIARDGVELFYELSGSGEPVVFVHGSWVDRTAWTAVVPRVAATHQVVTYDRRGYSRTGRPGSAWTVHDDADDLAALIEGLDAAPAHVVTNSFGGNVAMRLAVKRPELIRSLCMHEPPVFELLSDDADSAPVLDQNEKSLKAIEAKLEAGDHEGGARQFVEEIAFGAGAWDQFPPELRSLFVSHAPTFLIQLRDPDELDADLEGLRSFDKPTLLTQGSTSQPLFARTIAILAETIPAAERKTIEGAAHVPHATHPRALAGIVLEFVGSS